MHVEWYMPVVRGKKNGAGRMYSESATSRAKKSEVVGGNATSGMSKQRRKREREREREKDVQR
jgi:hypothetical protein